MPSNKMIFFNPLKQITPRRIFFLGLLLVFFLSAFSPLPQDPAEGSIIDKILVIATGFASLVGISGAVGMLVSVARALKWISSDSQVAKVTAGLNLVAFIALVLFGVFRPDLSLDFLDATAAKIASLGLFVLGFILQMIAPAPLFRFAYQAGVPVLGAMGERAEFRAHFVGAELEQSSENWTTERKNKPN